MPRFARGDINDYNAIMAAITIRKLDEETKQRLRVRAAEHGRSMEEEARHILRAAVMADPTDLATRIRQRLEHLGGIELQAPERDPMREPPTFK